MNRWTLSIIASLLTLSCLHAEEKQQINANANKQKLEMPKRRQNQMASGYNAPYSVDVRGSWDLFAQGSFVYWQLSQDNMEVAFSDSLSFSQYVNQNQVKGNQIAMDFDYLPGFQAALGIVTDLDNWDAKALYTMVHGKNSESATGAVAQGTENELAPLFPTWGNPTIVASNAYSSAFEHWKCNLDLLDLTLGRSYYVGTSLVFHPQVGARAAWILQNVHVHYDNDQFEQTDVAYLGTLDVYERSHSWALGPRVLCETNWMVGKGMRFFGNLGGDVLYTKYKFQNKTLFTASGEEDQMNIGREKVFALRTHLDFELGLGWGSYFDNNNWYIDLKAGYGFQVFFNQTLPAFYNSSLEPGKQALSVGNLYAQGLTASVQLNF